MEKSLILSGSLRLGTLAFSLLMATAASLSYAAWPHKPAKPAPSETTQVAPVNASLAPLPPLSLPVNGQLLDRVVVVVNDHASLNSDVERAIAQAKLSIAAQNKTVPPYDVLRQDIIRQLIMRQVQLDEAHKLGVTVDESTLNNALTEFAQKQGAPSLAAFQQSVDARQPGAYARLREQLQDDLAVSRMRQQLVSSRISISEREIDGFLASPASQILQTNALHIAHIMVKYPDPITKNSQQKALAVAQKVDAALLAGQAPDSIVTQFNQKSGLTLDGGDMGWRTLQELPARFKDNIDKLTIGQSTGPMVMPEGVHVIRLLDKRNADNKTIVHQWQVRHILVSPTATLSATDAQARIEEIYKRLQSGASFADLAKTYSADVGSARNGGLLGWVATGEMVPEFERMMTQTTTGDFSQPFQSQFGWHILKIDNQRDQDVTDLAKRQRARQVLFDRKFEQESDNWLRELRSQAYIDMREGEVR